MGDIPLADTLESHAQLLCTIACTGHHGSELRPGGAAATPGAAGGSGGGDAGDSGAARARSGTRSTALATLRAAWLAATPEGRSASLPQVMSTVQTCMLADWDVRVACLRLAETMASSLSDEHLATAASLALDALRDGKFVAVRKEGGRLLLSVARHTAVDEDGPLRQLIRAGLDEVKAAERDPSVAAILGDVHNTISARGR